jgi:hypothetical protein
LDWAPKADLSHKPIKKAQLYRTKSRAGRDPRCNHQRMPHLSTVKCGRWPDAGTRRDKQPPLAGARWRCARHRSFLYSRRLATASRLHRSLLPGQFPAISFISSPTLTATTMHSAPLSPVSGRSTGGAAGAQLLPSTRRNLAPLKPQSLPRKTQGHRVPLMRLLRTGSRLPPSWRRRARRTWRTSAKSKGSAASSLRWLVLRHWN